MKLEKLEDMLKELGDEFCQVMEAEKESNFENVYNLIIDTYNLKDEITKLENNNNEPVISFLRAFYNFGFYTGIKFMLDPDDLNEETIKKVYN